MPKVKILMVIPTLGSGGAERVMLNLLNHLDRDIFEPVLYLQEIKGGYLTSLADDVEIISAGNRSGLARLLFLRQEIRRLRPQIVFIMMLPIVALAARLSGAGAFPILRETNCTPNPYANQSVIIRWLNRTGFRSCKAWIASTRQMTKYLQTQYKIDPKKIEVIHNPVDVEKIRGLSAEPVDFSDDEFNLVAIGSLTRQKGFDLLIDAVATLEHIPWRLRILGVGEEESALQQRAASHGIADRIEFLGFKSNPYAYLAHSDLFVLSSRWEGMPNVLLEAMACGVPVLATRCPTGPDEIITSGVDGQLCEINATSIATAIGKLHGGRERTEQLVRAASERIKQFDLPNIMQQYQAFFQSKCGLNSDVQE